MNITLWQQQMIQVFRSVVTILSRCWQKCVAVVRRFVVRGSCSRVDVQQVEVTPEQLARLEAEPCLTVRILQTPADDAGSVAGVVHAVAGTDSAEAGQDTPRKKTGNKAKQAKKARA